MRGGVFMRGIFFSVQRAFFLFCRSFIRDRFRGECRLFDAYGACVAGKKEFLGKI